MNQARNAGSLRRPHNVLGPADIGLLESVTARDRGNLSCRVDDGGAVPDRALEGGEIGKVADHDLCPKFGEALSPGGVAREGADGRAFLAEQPGHQTASDEACGTGDEDFLSCELHRSFAGRQREKPAPPTV